MRFPFHIFNPRNGQKPIIRYAHLCRFLAENRTDRDFRKLFNRVESDAADFFLLMLICKRDLKMARLSLESMAQNASVVPQLILAHDESLSSAEVTTAFQDWPGKIHIWDRESVIRYHNTSNADGKSIAVFCDRHIFGFKLAACLRASALGRTLYSDADVLWFGDIADIVCRYHQFPIYGSHELSNQNCDPVTLDLLGHDLRKKLDEKGRCCAGFVIYNKDFSNHYLLNFLVREISTFKDIHRMAEQTIINSLVVESGDCISKSDIVMQFLSNGCWNEKARIAIHYPGKCKYKFWIDCIRI